MMEKENEMFDPNQETPIDDYENEFQSNIKKSSGGINFLKSLSNFFAFMMF